MLPPTVWVVPLNTEYAWPSGESWANASSAIVRDIGEMGIPTDGWNFQVYPSAIEAGPLSNYDWESQGRAVQKIRDLNLGGDFYLGAAYGGMNGGGAFWPAADDTSGAWKVHRGGVATFPAWGFPEERFRTAAHETGHFAGLPDLGGGLMSPPVYGTPEENTLTREQRAWVDSINW